MIFFGSTLVFSFSGKHGRGWTGASESLEDDLESRVTAGIMLGRAIRMVGLP
jgi:hypothetical protein